MRNLLILTGLLTRSLSSGRPDGKPDCRSRTKNVLAAGSLEDKGNLILLALDIFLELGDFKAE